MFTAVANALIAIMTAVTTAAGASEKLAKSLDNLATVAEETSGAYVDQARINREKQKRELLKSLESV